MVNPLHGLMMRAAVNALQTLRSGLRGCSASKNFPYQDNPQKGQIADAET